MDRFKQLRTADFLKIEVYCPFFCFEGKGGFYDIGINYRIQVYIECYVQQEYAEHHKQ